MRTGRPALSDHAKRRRGTLDARWSESLSARIEFNAKSTSGNRRFRIHSDYSRNDGFDVGAVVNGSWPFSTAITGVRLFSGSPQFKGQGNVKLLGLRA